MRKSLGGIKNDLILSLSKDAPTPVRDPFIQCASAAPAGRQLAMTQFKEPLVSGPLSNERHTPVPCQFGLVLNDVGSDDTKDSDFGGFNGPNTSATFTLAPGGSNSTIDAGFFNDCD